MVFRNIFCRDPRTNPNRIGKETRANIFAGFDPTKDDYQEDEDWYTYDQTTKALQAMVAQTSGDFEDRNTPVDNQIYDFDPTPRLALQGPMTLAEFNDLTPRPRLQGPETLAEFNARQPRHLPSRLTRPWPSVDPHRTDPRGAGTSRVGMSNYYGSSGKRRHWGVKETNPFVLDLDFANLSLS